MSSLPRLIRSLGRTLRDTDGASSLMERFDELTKVLSCKVHDERVAALNGGERAFRVAPPGSDAEIAEGIRRRYGELVARAPALFPERYARFALSDAALARLAASLAQVTLGNRADDLRGLAYEELIRDTFEKGENQQFFTPRAIIEFTVELLGARLAGTVCDPACGTGGFLLGAARHTAANGTRASLRLLGIEIDDRLAWAARMNLDMHGVERFEVRHLPGAGALGADLAPLRGTVDVVITNPPFGSDLSHPDALAAFELGRGRPSRRRGVLFLERCLELVRPGGTVAIVLDDGVLNAPSTADARRHLLRVAHPLAIVSLPDTAFMPYATVKASLLLLERHGSADGGGAARTTFFAEAMVVGRKSNGDPLLRLDRETRRLVPDSDLPAILERWRDPAPDPMDDERAHVFRAIVPVADRGFARHGHRLDLAYHHPARGRAAVALASSPHPLRAVRELCDERNESAVPSTAMPDEDVAYIGLAAIEPHTGVCTPQLVSGTAVRSAAKRCQPGDILFARLRPELRKAALVPAGIDEGWASAECLVLAPRSPERDGAAMLPELLALLLRSDLAYGQIVHLVTGIGRPRINRAAVMAIELPVPPLAEQRALLERHAHAEEQARALLAEGERARVAAARTLDGAAAALLRELLSR